MDRAIRTTLALPEELLNAADQAVKAGKARSRNDLVAAALRHELAALERSEIDAAFEAMSADADYQQEALKIAHEFAIADWEAYQIAEKQE